MTIIWFTDHDRRDMLAAREERAYLDGLELRAARERPEMVPRPLTPEQLWTIEHLRIDPRPRLDPPEA